MGHAMQFRQKGFGVIDMMLWMVLFTSGLTLRAHLDSQAQLATRSNGYGSQISQINGALQELLATNPTFPDGVYTDLEFLRSTDCDTPGLANDHYLPCEFTLDTIAVARFFTNITITTTVSAVPGTDIKVSTAVFGPFTNFQGEPDPVVAGQVSTAVNGYVISSHSPITASVRSFVDIDRDTSEVIVTNTSNPVSDTWIRADGANFMNANFTFSLDADGVPRSGINNAAFIRSQVFIDWDDDAFGLDPSETSRLRRLTMDGDIQLEQGGAIFSTDGSIVVETSGELDSINLQSENGINLDPGPDDNSAVGEGEDRVVINGSGIIEFTDAFINAGAVNGVGGIQSYLTNFLPKLALQALWIASDSDPIVPAPVCIEGATPAVVIHDGRTSGNVYSPNQRQVPSFFSTTSRAQPIWISSDGSSTDGSDPDREISGWEIQFIDSFAGHKNQDERVEVPLEAEKVVSTYCDYSNLLPANVRYPPS